jgi:cobalt/nickel transport system permease protein
MKIAAANASSFRRLWITVAIFMLLTPLGILAAGTAWGEWSPAQLAQAASSAPTANSTSSNVPAGLQRLANLWTAPFPAYAPGFVHSRGFGYLLSAMFGVGLLLILSLVMRSWASRGRRKETSA